MTDKCPFTIDVAITRIREAIRPFPQAALFALAEEGFSSPFELLVACVISIRTLDIVTLSCAHRLFTLVLCHFEIIGYSLCSLTRASSVVNCQ